MTGGNRAVEWKSGCRGDRNCIGVCAGAGRTWWSLRLIAALLLGALALSGCSSTQSSKAAASNGGGTSTNAAAAASPAKGADQAAAPAAGGARGDAAKVTATANRSAAATAAGPAAAEKGPAPQPASVGGTPQAPAAGITPPIAADSSEGFNRKLIYKANLVMEVADYGDAQTKLRNLAALSGAFILQFTETTNDRERSGAYTIKVAAQGFTSFLDGLEKISPSLQRSVQGQDVTEEYVDLDARLKAKQAVEARLLSFMEKAQKADDLVAFSNELSKVQTEIEQIKGRVRYLDQNVALSTIELRVYQPLSGAFGAKHNGQTPFGERLQQAMTGSLKVMSEFAQGFLVVIAALFPVLILGAIVLAIYLVFRRRRGRKLQQIRAELKRELPSAPPDGDSTT